MLDIVEHTLKPKHKMQTLTDRASYRLLVMAPRRTVIKSGQTISSIP